MEQSKIDRLYDTFDVVHTKPLRIRDRQTGEYRQIGELPYITARQVMDRLDEVFGVFGWQVKFDAIDQKNVKCTLSVNIDGTWITKEDFGFSDNESSSDSGIKGAASDALKRAAVHFGIGRFLYDERGPADTGNRGNYSGNYQRQQQQAPRPAFSRTSRPVSLAERKTLRSDPYAGQPQKAPFGNEDDERRAENPVDKTMRLLSENALTYEDFHNAFGVAFSPVIIKDLIDEGWTPESIVGAVKGNGIPED